MQNLINEILLSRLFEIQKPISNCNQTETSIDSNSNPESEYVLNQINLIFTIIIKKLNETTQAASELTTSLQNSISSLQDVTKTISDINSQTASLAEIHTQLVDLKDSLTGTSSKIWDILSGLGIMAIGAFLGKLLKILFNGAIRLIPLALLKASTGIPKIIDLIKSFHIPEKITNALKIGFSALKSFLPILFGPIGIAAGSAAFLGSELWKITHGKETIIPWEKGFVDGEVLGFKAAMDGVCRGYSTLFLPESFFPRSPRSTSSSTSTQESDLYTTPTATEISNIERIFQNTTNSILFLQKFHEQAQERISSIALTNDEDLTPLLSESPFSLSATDSISPTLHGPFYHNESTTTLGDVHFHIASTDPQLAASEVQKNLHTLVATYNRGIYS